MKTYLRVGPPVYFVVNEGYDYERTNGQNLICGSSGCSDASLTQQVFIASLIPERYVVQSVQFLILLSEV